jgi:hypothetical protein
METGRGKWNGKVSTKGGSSDTGVVFPHFRSSPKVSRPWGRGPSVNLTVRGRRWLAITTCFLVPIISVAPRFKRALWCGAALCIPRQDLAGWLLVVVWRPSLCSRMSRVPLVEQSNARGGVRPSGRARISRFSKVWTVEDQGERLLGRGTGNNDVGMREE